MLPTWHIWRWVGWPGQWPVWVITNIATVATIAALFETLRHVGCKQSGALPSLKQIHAYCLHMYCDDYIIWDGRGKIMCRFFVQLQICRNIIYWRTSYFQYFEARWHVVFCNEKKSKIKKKIYYSTTKPSVITKNIEILSYIP